MCKSPYIHERKIVINHTTDRVGSGGDALQMLTSVVTEGSSDRRSKSKTLIPDFSILFFNKT